ncbi:MAG: GAF domain-containing protein, partial [Chloroflexi bacterium]|nr:GAF domain-containing protein [Chloroflexota bacterium]
MTPIMRPTTARFEPQPQITRHRVLSAVIVSALAVLTVAALAINPPTREAIATHSSFLLIYSLLTAFALNFGVALSDGELSLAHGVGIIAFLSLPVTTQPTMTWALALGALIGGGVLALRRRPIHPDQVPTLYALRGIVIVTARVTLSFAAAAQFYLINRGTLPLQDLTWGDGLILVGYVGLYVLVYVALFLLQCYVERRSVQRLLRGNGGEILVALGLPVPFAVIGAEAFNTLSVLSFSIYLGGLMISIVGPYAISRVQYQFSRQLDKLRSLSVMGQAIRANLELGSLLNMVYVQVNTLLDVNNFEVVLYDREERRLDYPLVIRDGQQETHGARYVTDTRTLTDEVLHTENALLISHDVYAEAQRRGLVAPRGLHSWLGVPLIAGGHVLGAIIVTSTARGRIFGPDDLRLLNIVAAGAGVALENAQLLDRQMKRAAQLAQLNQVLSLLTGTLSPDGVLDTVISSASMISEASAVAVYLFWDEAKSTLALARSAGLDEKVITDLPDPLLADAVLNKDRQLPPAPRLVNDVMTDPQTAAIRDTISRLGKRAWIELPLVVGGVSVGVLVLYYNDPYTPTPESIELLRTFANQAGQAISNARLFTVTDEALERRVGQLLALAAIGHELTATIELRTICRLVLNHALEATYSKVGGILMLSDIDQPELLLTEGYPDGSFDNPALVKSGITGRALETGLPQLINNVAANGDYLRLMPTTRAQLSMPITRSGATLGALTLESDHENAFREDDVHFATQLLNQAVIAVDNARLFRRITEALKRLQVIVDAMEEAIVLIDSQGRISLANPRVRMIGLDPDIMVGQEVAALLRFANFDLAERFGFASDNDLRQLIASATQPANHTIQYTLDGESGVRHIERQVFIVADAGEQPLGILLIFYDKTEEQRLAQTREDISRMIIHDLRSPLTAVNTSLKLLNEVVPSDNDLHKIVETTTETGRRAVRKLLSRVDSLLDVSRMESGFIDLSTKPTELATLADNVCIELSPLAQELDVEISIDIADDLPLLHIDGDKVERLLLNLVDNALKFSPMASTVTVRTHAAGLNGALPGFVRVDVADMGPGVPDEYKQNLFDRFVQVKGQVGKRRGTGLGLAFCRLVAEAHGGKIW